MDNEKNSSVLNMALDCAEAELMLDEYLDEELSEVERRRVFRHLEACEQCRQAYDDTRLVIRTAKTLAVRPVPPAVSMRLRERLREELGIELPLPRPNLSLVE